MTFQELGLCPPILAALKDMGYEKPSPIQEKAIPPALKGRDVLGCAQTGTGKTCAFAAPILQQLNSRKAEPLRGVRPIRSLILTPTRELALQIQESFEAYGKNLPLRSAVIFGGVGQQPQVDALKRGVDILVATPGRLEDLHNQGYIHVEKLEIFVLDEADRMLDMGFIHDVKKILTWLPKQKQTLFFSATMPPEVQHLVDSLLVNPVKVAVDPVSSPVEVIDQRLFYVDRGNKSKLLSMLVKHPDVKNALVFTRTKHGANKVAADLEKAGIHAAAIHGNKSQTARQQALADFKAGRVKALVATDIAARGLDIEELSHVFNYNLPDVPETYVHRIGRTGRAGRGGTAVSFCEFGEKELLAPIEKLLKKPIPVVEGHPFPMEIFEAPKRDKHGKIVNADDAEARQAARERKKARDEAKKLAAGALRSDTPPTAVSQVTKHPAQRAVQTPPSSFSRRENVMPRGSQKTVEAGHPVAPKESQPKQASAQKGKDQPKTAPQPTASVKKQAGYRASKTLDEALSAMAPKSGGAKPKNDRRDQGKPVGGRFSTPRQGKPEQPASSRDAAFEAWLAEERKIQAQQYGRDPLAGEEIMDATARFLAPRVPRKEAPPERPMGRWDGRSPEGRMTSPAPREAKRPARRAAAQTPPSPIDQRSNDVPTVDRRSEQRQAAPGRQEKGQKGGSPSLQGEKPRKDRPKKTDGGLFSRKNRTSSPATPLPRQEPPTPKQPKQEGKRRNDRPRRGPVEIPHSSAQKDSTEQHSLMKPYYFNPDED